jgi:hypothetical protein
MGDGRLTDTERFYITWGKAFTGDSPLEQNPELWQALYDRHRPIIIDHWTKTHPGSRPVVWHRFDAAGFPPRRGDESELAWLHRIGVLDESEVQALVSAAHEACEQTRLGCRNRVAGENDEFLRGLGRLSDKDIETLWGRGIQ